jgi:ABC-type Zn2+ transport system substrate-binding protein/surface adhesin
MPSDRPAPGRLHDHGTAGTNGHDHGHDEHAKGHDEHAHAAHDHGPSFVMGIHFPGLYELGTMIGFLGLFLFVTFSFLERASLMPKNDPYVDESKNHHVWYDL